MRIPLTQGFFAEIDDEDAHLVSGVKWHALNCRGTIYAARAHYKNGNRKILLLHRVLMNPKTDEVIDHIDSDTLNNRRKNLRVCNQTENVRNRKVARTSTTGVKGVWAVENGRFRGEVACDGKRTSKRFKTIEAATAWVEEKRRLLHGEFAYQKATDSRER